MKEQSKNHMSVLEFYKNYILKKKYIMYLVSILFFSVLSSILQIVIPYLLKGIIDFAIEKNKILMYRTIWTFGVAWVAAVISAYIYGYLMEIIKVDIKRLLRLKLLEKIHTIPFQEVNIHTRGAYLQRIIDDIDKIDPLIIDSYLELGTMVFMAIGALIIMIKMSWLLSIVSIVPIPLYLILMVIYQKKAISLTQKRQEDYQNVIAFIDESIGNTYLIRNIGILNKILYKITVTYDKYVKSYLSLFKLNFFYSSVLNTFLSIGIQFFIILFGAILILKNQLTAGIVLSFMIYAEYIRQPMNYILTFSTRIEPSKVSLQRIFEILKKESVYVSQTFNYPNQDKAVYDNIPAIEIKNLTFSYDGTNPIIVNMHMTVKHGEWVCVVGESGRGKTTFLNILLKHYPVPNNTVFLFGKDINEMNVREVHNLITLIEQEPQFFGNLTIYENITLGEDLTWEEIKKIATEIGLKNLLEKINKTTLLKNAGLSGGEKKRLALLRGMLRNTPIVIIDEPTAFIDRDNALNMISKLKKFLKGKTVIITTHDEKIFVFCQRKVFMN